MTDEREFSYFNETLDFIRSEIVAAEAEVKVKKEDAQDSRNDILSFFDSADGIEDDDFFYNLAPFVDNLYRENVVAEDAMNRLAKLRRSLRKPYFARIDFTPDGGACKTSYIGRSSVLDRGNLRLYVHDWRSPVASLFYRFGTGSAEYATPKGVIKGTLSVKRQYEIKNSTLEYWFDSDIEIADEYLRALLGKNSSEKMKAIAETIQREQDEIIRDTECDLVMVQGVAGSGKTSVALHRAAFFMYEGLANRLASSEIVIISPNKLFEKYISNVLPELGERSVRTLGFDELIRSILGSIPFGTKREESEAFALSEGAEREEALRNLKRMYSAEYLDEIHDFASAIEKRIVFRDVIYAGETVFTSDALNNMLSGMRTDAALQIKLSHIEQEILREIHIRRPIVLQALEKAAGSTIEHFDEKREYARMQIIEDTTRMIEDLYLSTRLDHEALYRQFSGETRELTFSGASSAALLKLYNEPCDEYNTVRHVIIDEAQDYGAVHYEILRRVFRRAKFTILGDINQTLLLPADMSRYDLIKSVFRGGKHKLSVLTKSFRSTAEIVNFSERYIDSSLAGARIEHIGRSGSVPEERRFNNEAEYLIAIRDEITICQNLEYDSIALICFSEKEAYRLRLMLSEFSVETPVLRADSEKIRGVFIVPVYLSKGLEFDAVIVCAGQKRPENNSLYVATTRALHRLNVFSNTEE